MIVVYKSLLLSAAVFISMLNVDAVFAQTPAAPAVPAAPAAPAAQLVETHGDWQVVCADQKRAAQTCSFLQEQTNQSGQHLLAIELRPVATGLSGTLVMPFGLALPRGVTLQIDSAAAAPALAFATCLYSGCIAEVSFTRAQIAALRKGTDLKVSAIANDGSPINLLVPLKGFAEAQDRAATLVNGAAPAAPKVRTAPAPAPLQ